MLIVGIGGIGDFRDSCVLLFFFWLKKLPEYYFLAQAFRAGLRKLGPKNNIPEVSLTKKSKKTLFYVDCVGSTELLEEDEDKFFPAPAFVYCFPLLQWVLSNLQEVAGDEVCCPDNGDTREESGDESDEEESEEERGVKERESDRVACLGLQVSLCTSLNPLIPRRTLVAPFTKISILF